MDKQKEREEIARIIAFELCPNRSIHKKWGEEAQCYSDNNFAECKEIKNVVDKLYNAGYRKIPENAVVLTREELEQIKGFSREEVDEIIETAIKNSRKETAEKFAKRMKARFDKSREYYFIDTGTAWGEGQIGGLINDKIDEICKEITEGK